MCSNSLINTFLFPMVTFKLLRTVLPPCPVLNNEVAVLSLETGDLYYF